jgi:hypothetical protein
MNIIVYSFKQLPQGELPTFTNNVIQRMSTDVRFKDLKPHVDMLKAKYDAYILALSAASDGGRTLIIEKNKRMEELINQLVAVTYFVNILANGDESIAVAAGFEVRRPSKPIEKLPKPEGLRVKNDEVSGAVRLACEKIPGAVNFAIEHLVKDAADWKNGKYTTRSEVILPDYQPGSFVEFRIRALGRNGIESEWSSPVGVWVS